MYAGWGTLGAEGGCSAGEPTFYGPLTARPIGERSAVMFSASLRRHSAPIEPISHWHDRLGTQAITNHHTRDVHTIASTVVVGRGTETEMCPVPTGQIELIA